MKHKNESGVISVEASIATVLFIFCMLFFYCFFYITQARNAISHAMLQASQSMALDAYQSSKFTPDQYAALGVSDVGQLINECLGVTGGQNGYVDDSRWYSKTSGNLVQVARTRFAHYMSGSVEGADQKLTALGVEGGLDGVDFSGSYVEGRDLYLIASYDIEPWYNLFELKPLHQELTACSRLWGSVSGDAGSGKSVSGGGKRG